MRFHDSEADRLNSYLDARVQGHQVDPDDLEPTLVDAYEQVRAMDARPAPDPQLMTNLWRSMMSTIPADVGPRPQAPLPALPSIPKPIFANRRNALFRFAVALGVTVLLLGSVIGFQRFNDNGDPGQPTTIPAAFQETGTPTATGCEALPREPGSIAAILETQQTSIPYMPRFGHDPIYALNQDRQNADAENLLLNWEPDQEALTEIQDALQQLVNCRFYAIESSGAYGEVDMEGRYFALFSADFLRRELSGYREAGLPLELIGYWAPATAPEIIELRAMHGRGESANRVLAILDSPGGPPEGTFLVIFVEDNGRWLVDEVGYTNFEGVDDSLLATPVAGAVFNESSYEDSQQPLQLDIAIYDASFINTPVGQSAETDPTSCDPLELGTPVPCGSGLGYQLNGPYWYNEFPANTDFTLNLYNLGDEPKRFEIADLGIEIELEVGGSETIVLNAEVGEYLFTIYQGDQPDPIGAGVFTFISSEENRTMG
jgi:hypothetical protein